MSQCYLPIQLDLINHNITALLCLQRTYRRYAMQNHFSFRKYLLNSRLFIPIHSSRTKNQINQNITDHRTKAHSQFKPVFFYLFIFLKNRDGRSIREHLDRSFVSFQKTKCCLITGFFDYYFFLLNLNIWVTNGDLGIQCGTEFRAQCQFLRSQKNIYKTFYRDCLQFLKVVNTFLQKYLPIQMCELSIY